MCYTLNILSYVHTLCIRMNKIIAVLYIVVTNAHICSHASNYDDKE